jgi:hypothetical protein
MECGELGALGGEGCFVLAAAAFVQALPAGLHVLGLAWAKSWA